MEQHPVPRNISSFEFHLIGDMTLQQFFYLAGAAGMGFVIYKAAPFPDFIKYILIGITGFIGFSFAFLPIQERPLDRWILAFIKSILSPTQYLWQKDNLPPEILMQPAVIHVNVMPQEHIDAHKEAQNKLRSYLSTIPKSSHERLNVAEQNYINKTLSLFDSSQVSTVQPQLQPVSAVHSTATIINSYKPETHPSPIPISQPQPQKPTVIIPKIQPPSPQNPPVNTFKPVAAVQQVQPAPVSPNPVKTPPIAPVHKEYNDLQDQLKELMAEKEALAKQLEKLKSSVAMPVASPTIVNPVSPVEDKTSQPTIKYVSAKAAVDKIGLPALPQTPNVVIGVIKDPQRRILPNIIITIKDRTGLPLRALKTNKLGQFATATPLPNGTYLLEIDDPLKRYVFDTAEIVLSGKIFLPIEIVTKGEKEIMRDKLTKELFGSASV